MAVVCDANLTEAQMNEYPTIEKKERKVEKPKSEYPELKLSLWEK